MVSFIIPVYNGDKFISKCLDSIFAQTYKDFQLLVINDGSTDNTLSILEVYKEKFYNFDFTIISTENRGHSHARNLGITKATREYIWFVDADDVLYDDKSLESAIADFKKYQPDIYVFSVFETDYNRRNKVWTYTLRNKLTNINRSPFLLFKQNWSWNKPLRRDFLLSSGEMFPDEKMFEDIYFYVNLYLRAERIYLSNVIRYVYVKHDAALTSSLNKFGSYPNALFYELKAFLKVIFRRNKK